MTENKFGFEFVSVKPTWEWNQHMPVEKYYNNVQIRT